METKLKLGDRVKVYWEQLELIEGTIANIPGQTGEAFIIISDDDTIHYVQNYHRITKIR